MNFYVYEDDTRRLLRVHTGHCQYCNDGQGRKLTHSFNKRWHGPYVTLTEAQAFATSLKRKNTRTCAACLNGKRFNLKYIWDSYS